MLPTHSLLLPLFGSAATAANLWATHYSGTANYLSFTGGNALTLSKSSSTGNNKNPSWITYDGPTKALYIPDELSWGAPAGSLTSFAIGNNGSLTAGGSGQSPLSAVATTLYGGKDGKSFIATAHYGSSQVSTHKLPLDGGQPLQTLKYTMNGPGANPNRQEAPHPHHVVVDPTGDFLVVPDLGADLIRINKIDKSTGKLTECNAVKQVPGNGPRHGVFWSPEGSKSRAARAAAATTLFIANELSNSVSGWAVSYTGGCMSLKLKNTITPYQGNSSAPVGTKLAEIRTKGKFLYTSNRNDKKFNGNDSMTQYTIAPDGTIGWTDLTSSYGTYPRTFEINKAGTFVAIGDQTTANVAIVARDTATGKLGKQVANLRIGTAGQPESETGLSAVVWEE